MLRTRVRVLAGFVAEDGRRCAVGETVELNAALAKTLIARGRAMLAPAVAEDKPKPKAKAKAKRKASAKSKD